MSSESNQSSMLRAQSMSFSKSEIIENESELVYRAGKSEIYKQSEIKKQNESQVKVENRNQQPIKESWSCQRIIIGLVILGLVGGLALGYKIIKSGNIQDEEQMNVFVNIVSQSLLQNLEQQKFLIIEDQKQQLKKFYEKQLTNILWQKIVNYIQQQPNVQISKDNKQWILKE